MTMKSNKWNIILKRIGISLALPSGYLFYNTLFIDRITEFKRRNESSSISVGLKNIVNKTLSESLLQLSDELKSKIKVNTFHSLEPWSMGTTLFTNGQTILLPEYFNVEHANELRSHMINKYLKDNYNFEITDNDFWFTSNGADLIKSFLLSEKAKAFAFAKEINTVDENLIIINYFLIALCVYLQSIMARMLISRRDKTLPVSAVRGKVAIVSLVFAFSLYLMIWMLIYAASELNSDAKAITNGMFVATELTKLTKNESNRAAIINDYYFDGALEYYQMQLKRNLAIKKYLCNSSSVYQRYIKSRMFTNDGDFRSSIINLRMPLLRRLDNFQSWKNGEKIKKKTVF